MLKIRRADTHAESIRSEQENTQLVKQAYDKFVAGDIDGLLEMFSDDIEWQLDDIEHVPFGGRRYGKEGVAEFFRLLEQSQQTSLFAPTEFFAQGDKVVALGRYAGSAISTSRP